jgi:hypothetical protein
MNRQWWVKLVRSTASVFGYFWYKNNIPSVVARVLS